MRDITPRSLFLCTQDQSVFRRLFPVLTVCGCCLMSPPASAGWLGKRLVRKPEPAVPSATTAVAGTIRRLTTEAQREAELENYAAARTLAERAYKLSLTNRMSLMNDPDCAVDRLAVMVRTYGEHLASREKSQSPPQNLVRQPDLSALLDVEVSENDLVPPAPAPAIRPEPVARRSASLPIAAESPPAKRPAHVAANPTSSATPNPIRRSIETPSIEVGSQLGRDQRKAQAGPLAPPLGFLVRRSDWLSPEATSTDLLKSGESFAIRATPIRKVEPLSPPQTEPTENRTVKEESEVTTALGDSEHPRWELDMNSIETETQADARPRLDNRPHDEAMTAEPLLADGQFNPGQRLPVGVWSAEGDASATDGQVRNVVSLSEFFDPTVPVVRSPAGRNAAGDSPRMIETDFRESSPISVAATVASPERPEQPKAASPAVDDTGIESVTAVCPVQAVDSQRPAVSFREDPALDWLPATPLAAAPLPADPNALQHLWREVTQSQMNQFAAGGLFLLLCGMTLFGLSFRQSPASMPEGPSADEAAVDTL